MGTRKEKNFLESQDLADATHPLEQVIMRHSIRFKNYLKRTDLDLLRV